MSVQALRPYIARLALAETRLAAAATPAERATWARTVEFLRERVAFLSR